MADMVKVLGVGVVLDKGRKLELAGGVGVGRRGDVPDLDLAAEADGEVAARGRKGEGRDLAAKGEVVGRYSALDIGQDGVAVLVDGEQEVAPRREADAGDVLAVGKGKRVRLVAARRGMSAARSCQALQQ